MSLQINTINTPHQRNGIGFDVHAFDTNKDTASIRLFGADIPHIQALKGHSDADVGLHALCDAIYGICAMGDIGVHFPPSDDAHKGQDSTVFLDHAINLLQQCGGALMHIDLVLIGEAPKMTPHRQLIIDTLSKLTNLSAYQIGFKATTTEQLGFTGRKEGLACQAMASAIFKHGFIPPQI